MAGIMHEKITIDQEELDELELTPERPSRWRKLRRGLKWAGIVVGLLVVAVVAFVLFNLFKVTGGNPFSFGKLKGESDGRVNIMMLGVGDPGHAGEQLSDTNIILSVDTRNHQVAVIGIPRDLVVDIPGYGYGKINNANARGGIKTAKTVYEDTFGVPIHYYVKANFTGLKQVVDAVGGVDVNNTNNLYDPEYPCDNNQYRSCGYSLKAGPHHLNGNEALKYVRCRKNTCGDDFGRAARQQEVMQQIRDKATSAGTLSNPVSLGKLVSAAGSNVDTNLSINNLMRLNELTKAQNGQPTKDPLNIVFNTTSGGFLKGSGPSDLVPVSGDFDAIQHFVQQIFTLGPIWVEHPTVMIENGTTTSGIAGQFQDKLESDAIPVTIAGVINALKRDYTTTQIIDYSGGKRPNTSAYLAKQLGVAVSQPDIPVKTPPADIVVILGADYAAKAGTSSSSGSSGSGKITPNTSSSAQ
jgi:LCP family protein required for cell wall assembly